MITPGHLNLSSPAATSLATLYTQAPGHKSGPVSGPPTRSIAMGHSPRRPSLERR
jgi:hypothetical protein